MHLYNDLSLYFVFNQMTSSINSIYKLVKLLSILMDKVKNVI